MKADQYEYNLLCAMDVAYGNNDDKVGDGMMLALGLYTASLPAGASYRDWYKAGVDRAKAIAIEVTVEHFVKEMEAE